MKSLVDRLGTLTKGGLVVKTTEGGLVVKTTEVGEDIWDLDISRWDDVVVMDVGRVVIMGGGKLAGGEFGTMNESYFFFNNPFNFSVKFRKIILITYNSGGSLLPPVVIFVTMYCTFVYY